MADDEKDLTRAEAAGGRPRSEDAVPALGSWHWVADEEVAGGRWLGCVTHVGSNYVELKGRSDQHISHVYDRIHHRELDRLTPEPDAAEMIRVKVAECQAKILEFVRRIASLKERLALSGPPVEETALAVRGAGTADEYKRELVRLRDETLPELKSQIEAESRILKSWMELELLPTEAQVDESQGLMEPLKKRIFAVELYAGLVESLVEVRGGDLASEDAPVHLFQRRHYMDEECLARYEAGGMSIENLGEFDAWLVRPENLGRILPHPRSVVAFRVRRKERKDRSFEDFVQVLLGGDADKLTFLYLRNGDRVYRLQTEVDFGEKLFPDVEKSVLVLGKVYGKRQGWYSDDRDFLISEGQYLDILRREAEVAKLPEDEQWRHSVRPGSSEYVLWDRETVYYDDISERVRDAMEEHNRLVVLLQGIFDRSEAFQPHAPCRLWSPDDFGRFVRLVHDDSRALVPGDAPDFETYRARLNSRLKRGAHTVGQEDYWERACAQRENSRYRGRHYDRDLVRYRPDGNPGPGLVAVVESFSEKGCTFRWTRQRLQSSRSRYATREVPDELGCQLRVPASELLCVDGYEPGDYRIFYDDPRTRADYLKWAPLLLAAEDWHAGKTKTERRIR